LRPGVKRLTAISGEVEEIEKRENIRTKERSEHVEKFEEGHQSLRRMGREGFRVLKRGG